MHKTKNRRTLRHTLLLLAALALCTYCVVANLPEDAALPRLPTRTVTDGAPEEPEGEEWMLQLVNRDHPLPQAYTLTLVQLRNDQAVDERCYPDLQAMMDDCRAAGLSPLICSSWRSWEKQTELYRNKVGYYTALGLSQAEAEAEAGKIVAVPGTSEHQLGLAVDIVDEGYQHLDEAQEDTAVQQWLLAHSWEYGFVLRYPPEKSDLTGIIYEPWHYRYVGKAAAGDMHRRELCLEEYLEGERY